jgi:hypothetical protein
MHSHWLPSRLSDRATAYRLGNRSLFNNFHLTGRGMHSPVLYFDLKAFSWSALVRHGISRKCVERQFD